MNKHWYTFATLTELAQPLTVWVEESHVYNAGADRLEITWKLRASQVVAQTLKVNIYHSSTETGVREYWNWDINSGTDVAQGLYFYPLSNIGTDVEFGIQEGTGYAVGTPHEVRVLKPTAEAPQGDSQQVPDKYSVSYTNQHLILSDTDFVNGKYYVQGQNLRSVLNEEAIIDYSNVSEGNELIIEDNIFMTSGIPVFGGYSKARVTARNNFCFQYDKTQADTRGWGLWMVRATNSPYVTIEHNYVEGMGLVMCEYNKAFDASFEGLSIRYNYGKNIYGVGDFQNFIKLTSDGASIPNAFIEWNQTLNIDDVCRLEDNISLYHVRGTQSTPMQVANNFIDGASKSWLATSYTGGGVMIDCAREATDEQVPAYIHLINNQAVRCHNYCFAIAGGWRCKIIGNRAVVAAVNESGQVYNDWTSGIWTDLYNMEDYDAVNNPNPSAFGGENEVYDNVVGVNGQGGGRYSEFMFNRNTSPYPRHTNHWDNSSIPGTITRATEDNEYTIWQEKLAQNSVTIGPVSTVL